jgi:hypothetical protein
VSGGSAGGRWRVTCDGKKLPPQQGWTPVGELAAKARLEGGALKFIDDVTKKGRKSMCKTRREGVSVH